MVALVLTVGISAFILLRRPPPSLPVHTIAALPPAPVTIRAAPKAIQKVVAQLGEDFDGKAGIAVADVGNHWIAGYHAGDPMPQQSVSKLWVAITLLDAVDHGRVRLDERVTVRSSDLTIFHQPLRGLIGAFGFTTTLGDLMKRALTESDNTANDMLLRRVGGAAAIRRMLVQKGLAGIAFGPGERLLQAQIAGLKWQPVYSDGWSFERARHQLSGADRRAALAAYVANPMDGASPIGIVQALAALRQGKLLSPASTTLLLDTMGRSRTGRARLRAGLAPGWTLAHKTGTGQELGRVATGFNDVGLLTAPSGRVYAAAVMIAQTEAPTSARQHLISSVAQAIAAYDATLPAPLAAP